MCFNTCGVGGCPAELLRYAYLIYGLLPDDDPDFPLPDEVDLAIACHLTRSLKIVYEVGKGPEDWDTVPMTPIQVR